MLSAKFLGIPSSPVSRLSVKMLKSTGPGVEPCGTPVTASFGVSCVPEPPAHSSGNRVTQLDEEKLPPPVPLNPQGCDSRATSTHSPPRTAWPLHPRAPQSHQGEAHTTSWVYSSPFSPCWAFKRSYLQRKHGSYFLGSLWGLQSLGWTEHTAPMPSVP